ncbi:MAG: DUF58 domain-containing protein, partial [Myxococcota bacterium]
FFNAILLIWLGLTVLFNAERRTWGIWLAGGGLLCAALVTLDLWAWRGEPALCVSRWLPERAHLGRECELRVCLENPGPRLVEADVWEAIPADLAPASQEFPRVRVPSGGRSEVPFLVRPSRRGDRSFGRLVVLTRSPLGLFRLRQLGPGTDVLRVYPDTAALLRPEALDPRRALAALGVRPAPRRGEGMEFESLRDYVAGDDPRRLDWAASARRGRPIVRLHQHERNHTVLIALDASRLMAARVGQRRKLDHAVDAALALAHAALLSGDRVALSVFDREVRGFLAPRSHRRELGPLIELLRPLEPRLVEADFAALVRTVGARQRQRALVVVITDFVEAGAAAPIRILHLLGRRHQVLLVAVRDPLYAELDAGAHGSPGASGALRRMVLDDLLLDRERALLSLRRAGLHTLDLPPAQLVAPVLNRYLELRYGPGR